MTFGGRFSLRQPYLDAYAVEPGHDGWVVSTSCRWSVGVGPHTVSGNFSSFCRLFKLAGLGLSGNAEGQELTTTSPT